MTKEQTYFFVNVLEVVAGVYRVSPNDILGDRRFQRVAEARQMVYLLLTKEIDTRKIPQIIKRHPSTVKVGREKIRDMISLYKDTQRKYKRITKKLGYDNQNDTTEAGSGACATGCSSKNVPSL